MNDSNEMPTQGAAQHRLLYGLVALALILLMVYVWAGRTLAPFHGDEADQLYKSRDFVTVYIHNAPEKLQVRPPVAIHSPEHLRMLTGTTTAYLNGAVLWMGGLREDKWASAWYYGADFDWNITHGRMPDEKTLWRGRIPSTLLTMLAVVLMFWLGFLAAPENQPYFRIAAGLVAAVLLTTHPVWLLNGRRVMQEAALGTLSLACLLIGIYWIKRQVVIYWVALGLVGGAAMAAKLTGAVIVALVLLSLGVHCLRERRSARKMAALAMAAALSFAVFLSLTPAYWDAPLARLGLALELRRDMLQGQTDASEHRYETKQAQWSALLTQPFLRDMQYYESPDFAEKLDDAIYQYEISGIGGWQMPTAIGIGWTVVAGVGLISLLIRYKSEPAAILFLTWIIGSALFTGFSVPLAWQRYYLLWTLPMCLLVGLGMAEILGRAVYFGKRLL